jgi:hypothetical protein
MHSERKEINDVFIEMMETQKELTEVIRGVLGVGNPIDEMALMFQNSTGVFTFLTEVVQREGVALVNAARDVVQVSPLPARYGVQYWFLTSGHPEWRVEAMLTDGNSPLHYALSQGAHPGSMTVVHGSFKCPNEEEYATARVALRKAGWEEAQRCDSQYGRFSYWLDPDGPREVYLKPRVNLRDAS